MAISARTASLREQRSGSVSGLYGRSGIPLLSPKNNSVASIARQAAGNELNVMVTRYNNGEVSNEDMKAFLTKMSKNIGISESDRLEVETQIKDFDSRIIKDKLEANYKAAPDGTLQQFQAAQALSSYYNQRASTMEAGTPAQSQNLQAAADWVQRSNNIKEGIAKQAAQQLRYQEELKVNSLPNNTSERSYQKAQMYEELYNRAVADGDMVAANKYAAYYQQQVTTANEQAEKEEVQGEKQYLRDVLGSYVDAYHDGKINESQYLQLLAEIAPRIDATNDYGLINGLNRTTDTIQKNLDKGGLKRGVTASGLPVVLGKNKGGSGSGSGIVTDWDQQDFNYTDSIRKLKNAFESGKITGEEYSKAIGEAVITHAGSIQEKIAVIEAIAAENPNAKVLLNGRKTRAEDALERLDKDFEDIRSQAQAVEQGTFAIAEVAPEQFNKSGEVGSGKGYATYKLIDTNNLPENKYVMDTEGILHMIGVKTRQLTPAEAATLQNGQFQSQDGQWYPAKEVSPGVYETETGERDIRAYKPGTSEYLPIDMNKEGVTPSFNNAAQMLKQDKMTADIKKRRESERQLKIEEMKSTVPAVKTVDGVSLERVPQNRIDLKPIAKDALTTAPQSPDVVMPKQQVEAPKVVAPVPYVPPRPVQQETSGGLSVNQPRLNTQTQTGTGYQAPKQPTLKLATQSPSPVAQLAQRTGQKPVQIQAPPKGTTGGGAPQLSLSPVEFAKQKIINPIKNFFGF